MSAEAWIFFGVAAVLVWGGLFASILALWVRPEVDAYPDGGVDSDLDETT